MMRKARKSREMEKHKHKDSRPSKNCNNGVFLSCGAFEDLVGEYLQSGGSGLHGWNTTA
jgi:hypothetical protein